MRRGSGARVLARGEGSRTDGGVLRHDVDDEALLGSEDVVEHRTNPEHEQRRLRRLVVEQLERVDAQLGLIRRHRHHRHRHHRAVVAAAASGSDHPIARKPAGHQRARGLQDVSTRVGSPSAAHDDRGAGSWPFHPTQTAQRASSLDARVARAAARSRRDRTLAASRPRARTHARARVCVWFLLGHDHQECGVRSADWRLETGDCF